MEKKCFVIQRFDGARYDRLYRQIFEPSIKAAGFTAYRVDQDPSASIPIESIEREISISDACFVELSEDAPNVWFELGFAIARNKPLCLVCSDIRPRFPFDVQHRQIIRYAEHSLPDDFSQLGNRIQERLISILNTDVAMQQNANAADALAVAPETSGLKAHELLVLTMVFQSQFVGESNGWTIQRDMERSGYAPVASGLAIAGLKRKKLISGEVTTDDRGEPYTRYSVTDLGEQWLIEHEHELKLRIKTVKFSDLGTADLGITDEDIPF